MMEVRGDQLALLQEAVNEYYTGQSVNTERRKEIESLLYSWKTHPDSWRVCSHILSTSTNPLVVWFAASCYEHVIRNGRWEPLTLEEKHSVRSAVLQCLVLRSPSLQSFVSTKLAEVFVEIAKVDWPAVYPGFLSEIQQLLQDESTCAVGLGVLKLAAEELSSTKEDLLIARKEELRALFLENIPGMLSHLFQLLQNLFKLGENATANEAQVLNLCRLTLEVVSQLFLFAGNKIADVCRQSFLDVLFHFASLLHRPEALPVATDALKCLHDLVNRGFVAHSFHAPLLAISNFLSALVTSLASRTAADLVVMDPSYLENILSTLQALITHHSRRLSDSLQTLFGALCGLTLVLPSPQLFLSALRTWSAVIDVVRDAIVADKENNPDQPSPLEPVILRLGMLVLQRTQFATNERTLTLLDDTIDSDDPDDDEEQAGTAMGHTELDKYRSACLGALSKVANIYPTHALQLLYGSLCSHADDFVRASQQPNQQATQGSLWNLARDLTLVLRLFGALATQLDSASCSANAVVLLTKTLEAGAASRNLTSAPISNKVLNEVFSTLRSIMSFLQSLPPQQLDLLTTVSAIMDLVATAIDPTADGQLRMGALQVLDALTKQLRPVGFLSLPSAQALIANLHSLFMALPLDDAVSAYTSMVNAGLLPSPSIPLNLQGWDARANQVAAMVSPIAQVFASVKSVPNFVQDRLYLHQQVVSSLERSVRTLARLVQSVKTEGTKTRAALHHAIASSIEDSLQLFPLYLPSHPLLDEFVSFFEAILDCLKSQVGASFIATLVGSFLQAMPAAHIRDILAQNNASALQLLCRILQLWKILADDPSPMMDPFVPEITRRTISEIAPAIFAASEEVDTHDVHVALVEVIYALVKSHFKTIMLPAAAGPTPELLCMLQLVERGLKEPDLDLVRSNLTLLDHLHRPCKIDSLPWFTSQGHLSTVTQTLLQVLCTKCHDILREDLTSSLHHLASVSWDHFFNQSFPAFLRSAEGLTDSDRHHLHQCFIRDTDVPTFSSNVSRLVNDINYFWRRNIYSPSL